MARAPPANRRSKQRFSRSILLVGSSVSVRGRDRQLMYARASRASRLKSPLPAVATLDREKRL